MKRSCRRWKPDEVAFVREMTAMRFSKYEIARLLDRTPAAVSDKRHSLGFKFPPAPKPEPLPIYLVADIKSVVARHFSVRSEALSLPVRTRKYSRPRQVAFLLAREVARKSLPDIGRMFKRDHSTVIHGIRNIRKVASEDSEVADKISAIRLELKPVEIMLIPTVFATPTEA